MKLTTGGTYGAGIYNGAGSQNSYGGYAGSGSYSSAGRIPYSLQGSTAGMHNIRPAGQMWPAKAFKLALKALIYIDLA